MECKELVGHESIVEHLTTAVKVNKISHAYIFHGDKGLGKRFLAHYFAKLLQCEAGGETSCGVCKSCLQADSGNHPDIIFVTHEKNSIGVDDIRIQINNDIVIKPYSSKYKIYIMEDADKMTEQAQNALLKTIEEPPSYGIILLLACNINRLLPTIQSRCVALKLRPVEDEKIESYLIKTLGVPDYVAKMAAEFSSGNIGRATRYAMSDDFSKMKEDVLHFLRHKNELHFSEKMDYVKGMGQYKSEIKDCIDLMILWFRDVLIFKVMSDPNRLIFKEEYKYIAKEAATRDYEGIEKAIAAMEKAKVRLDANVNFDTVIELMLLSISEK